MSKVTQTAVINMVLLGCVDILLGMDAMDVVAQCEKTLEKFRSLDVAYTVTYSWLPDLPKHSQWTYDSTGRRRLRTSAKTLGPDATPANTFKSSKVIDVLQDVIYTGNVFYQLSDLNPKRHTPTTPLTEIQIKMRRTTNGLSPTEALVFSSPRVELLMTPAVQFMCSPVRTFSEEVQEAINLFGRQAVGCARDTIAGHECWKVTYPYPGCIVDGKLVGRGDKVALYFDPSVGWLVRRKSIQEVAHHASSLSEVRKLITLRDGLWFPMEIENQFTYANGEVRTTVLTVERAIVNEPIDAKRWEFHFPPGAVVGEVVLDPNGEERADRLHIVGEDGTLVKTFKAGSKEWEMYLLERVKQYRLSATRSRKRIAASMIALLLVTLGGVALWRRRKNLTRIIGVAHQGTK